MLNACSYLSSHGNKLYQEGKQAPMEWYTFLTLSRRVFPKTQRSRYKYVQHVLRPFGARELTRIDGKPHIDRSWTECFAQLVGTVLSLWDAAALDAAGQDGEVAPTFINLADASIKMVRTDGPILEPLTYESRLRLCRRATKIFSRCRTSSPSPLPARIDTFFTSILYTR